MKNTEKQAINTTEIRNQLDQLLEVVSKSIQEHGFDNVVDAVKNDMGDYIYESEAFSALDFVREISTPAIEAKRYGLRAAMEIMNDSTLCELYNLATTCIRINKDVNKEEVRLSNIKGEAYLLNTYGQNMLESINSEWFERTQHYRSDLERAQEKLKAVKA